MSYLVLARKSRPQRFEEVVGQKPIVRTLRNALQHERVPHALIFSGVRGTGKTTLARIMAKALNCEQGPTPVPCNTCRSCREIATGNSVDLQEVDGASNRGIQEIRDLKEKIRFMPTSSRFKIIIIDEVHMLTTEAFNALLKTLEEPPDHVYFIFATTELHKVPITILSRCQRYELKRVSRQELFHHFQNLAKGEGIEIEEGALQLIVREAGGSVRDGLSLLDQVFSYCGTKVTLGDVTEVLGLVSQEIIAGIANAILDKDLETALQQLDQIYAFGMNHKRFINEILDWFRNLVVFKVSANASLLLDLPEEEMSLMAETAARYSAQTFMQIFSLLLEPFERAGYSNRPRFQIEMALIRAVQAEDVVALPEILSKFSELLGPVDGRSIRQAVSKPSSPPEQSSVKTEMQKPVVEPEELESSHQVNNEEPGPTDVVSTMAEPLLPKEPDKQKISAAPKQKAQPEKKISTPAAAKQGEKGGKDVRRHWDQFVEYVRERKQWMALSLQRAKDARLENGELLIRYEDPVDCRLLKSKDNINSLTEYALDFFQGSFQVRFKVPDGVGCEVDPENGVGPRKERQALANDPLVLTALEIFNGQIGDIRVGPRFREPMHAKKTKK